MRNIGKSTTKMKTALKGSKGSAKQFAFLKYYLSESINGEKNPCFGNAYRSAKRVGYSESYAKKILVVSSKSKNGENPIKLMSENIRKGSERYPKVCI